MTLLDAFQSFAQGSELLVGILDLCCVLPRPEGTAINQPRAERSPPQADEAPPWVGKTSPTEVDILLVRRETEELSKASRRDLSELVPLLNRFTLIEFKGPTDALEPGDLAQLVGCAFLWHSQQGASIPQAEISLIVLAPSVNEAVRDELQSFGWQLGEHEAGVHHVTGGPFTQCCDLSIARNPNICPPWEKWFLS